MPLYEYSCAQCGRFERIQRFSDAALVKCPTCDGPVHKLISAPAIQFKGSGWYVTDYAHKSGPPETKAAEKSSTSSTPTSSTSKDSSATGSSPTQ